MPINIDAEDFLKIIKDNTFQKIFVGLVLVVCSFFAGKATAPECKQSIICSDIIRDRDILSAQLTEERSKCQTEKVKSLQALTSDLNKDCALRIDEAIGHCEFSEDLHCPICVARGVCSQWLKILF